MPRAKTIAGAAVTCFVNGRPFGRVRDFQWSAATTRRAVYGIDVTEPLELLPTTTKVTGRLTLYRTIGDAGAEGAAMASRTEDLLRERYFGLMLLERGSSTVLFEARFCSVVSQSWSVPERGVVTGTVEFEALDWNNELRPLKL